MLYNSAKNVGWVISVINQHGNGSLLSVVFLFNYRLQGTWIGSIQRNVSALKVKLKWRVLTEFMDTKLHKSFKQQHMLYGDYFHRRAFMFLWHLCKKRNLFSFKQFISFYAVMFHVKKAFFMLHEYEHYEHSCYRRRFHSQL